jgi:hypothetical protein
MASVSLGKPSIKPTTRAIECLIESYATVERFDRVIGITIESSYGHGVRMYLADYSCSEKVWELFDGIFGLANRKGIPSLVSGKRNAGGRRFLAEWKLSPDEARIKLKEIEDKLGSDWKEAFHTIWSVKPYNLVD